MIVRCLHSLAITRVVIHCAVPELRRCRVGVEEGQGVAMVGSYETDEPLYGLRRYDARVCDV